MFLTLRVFFCICPQHCKRNSCHNVETFLLSSGIPTQIVTHIWRAKAKICSTFAFEFFLKFWPFVESIQSSFLFSFQKYKFFWNRTKIDVFMMFFLWYYFLCRRIPSFWENGYQNVKILWEEFRCHLMLWVTMWAEFFSHCEKIVRKLWVEMNTLIVFLPFFHPTYSTLSLLSYSVWVTLLIAKSWNTSHLSRNIYHLHYFHQDEYVHMYVDYSYGRYFSTWWSSMWLTLKTALSNWVGSLYLLFSWGCQKWDA